MSKRLAWRLLLALPLLVTGVARASVEVPVAVMPFKNLSTDPALDWLKAGMAETMISDLKKAAGLAVVERSQLDHALAELALRGAGGTDEATAAQVGKLTGAKTVVLGSFQAAGPQLRISARFVTVETGEVQDAAKVTGPVDDIFRLQDEVIAKLTGAPAATTGKAPARKARKSGPQVVKAYRLYAMSLATGSDAERVGYLRDSLKEDPSFSYAEDDLAALESRMKAYDQAADRARDARESNERRALQLTGDTPESKAQHAMQLLTSEMTSRRYRELLGDARAVEAMDLHVTGPLDPLPFAGYAIVLAHQQLKQRDQALQAGERFLKNFPSSPYYAAVEAQMQQLIREKREIEEGAAAADGELAKLDREKADVLAHPPRNGVNPVRLESLDFQRCTVLYRHRQYERAVSECRHFEDEHRGESAGPTDFAHLCAYHRALSLAELGRFDEARDVAQHIRDDVPAFAQQMAIPTTMSMWPKE